MSPSDFSRILATTSEQLLALATVKGGEYAPGADRLANFKEAGARLGLLPEQVLLVYLDKHYAAVGNFIRDLTTHTSRVRSEPIEGRVDDLLVYLVLFKGLLAERRQMGAALDDAYRFAEARTDSLEWDD